VDLDSARAHLEQALRDFLAVPDAALTGRWRWRERETERRYGFYRCCEVVEEAIVALEGRRLARAEGGRILGRVSAARWDLQGLLQPIEDRLLDRDPGGGEWTLRATLGHILEVQERYTASTADAVERGRRGEPTPAPPPGGRPPPSRDPSAHAPGTLAEIRARLDRLVDEAVARFADVDDEPGLSGQATWAGYAVTARFRMHRMAAHLREHTVQVEKTLALLEHRPREVDRLVRLIAATYGRLEGATLGAGPAPDLLGQAAERVAAHARELATERA
jgi:uncharacterized damage-inducible protein DinB